MPKTIEAIYEEGVFKPLKKIRLKEHEKVELTISIKSKIDESVKNAFSIIGIGESSIKDSSINHDEYLYGSKHIINKIKSPK